MPLKLHCIIRWVVIDTGKQSQIFRTRPILNKFINRVIRSIVSYIPSRSLLTLRNLKDLPLRLLGKPHEVDFEFFRYLNLDSPVIIDVGANRGQSIESFKSVVKKPDIHSVEPNSMLADSLRKRFPDVTVYNIGLGETPAEMELIIPRYGHTFWDTRASLSPEYARNFLSDIYFFMFNEKRSGLESLSVSIDLLDNLEIKPDILKIDAEGLEEQILLGGSKTLD